MIKRVQIFREFVPALPNIVLQRKKPRMGIDYIALIQIILYEEICIAVECKIITENNTVFFNLLFPNLWKTMHLLRKNVCRNNCFEYLLDFVNIYPFCSLSHCLIVFCIFSL